MADAPSPRQRSDSLVERSKSLWEIGRWKDAEAQARHALAADPAHTRARLQLAHVLTSTGRGDEGAQLAKSVLAEEPNSAWAMRILGCWHGQHGRHGEALALAKQAVRASEGDSVALLYLSHACKDAGDDIGARIVAEQMVARYPEWPDAFVRLAETRHSPAEAAQAYREALRLDPHNDAALAGLAVLSSSLVQYREAVSLAWSALRADVTDKDRQRVFVRSAWTYLALSRIVAPLRSTRRALAEPFGDACAHAFLSTGPHGFARLLFAFPLEIVLLSIWTLLAAAMVGSSFLPDDYSVVLVPLLGIPVFIGLAFPFFLSFSVIAAARRLLDFRLVQWAGRGSLRSLLARAAVSGVLLVGLACVLLLAWPTSAGMWGWLVLIGSVLAVQDLSRWREQWRDSRRTGQTRSMRESIAAWVDERAPRWFTTPRLLTFLLLALGIDLALREFDTSLAPTASPLQLAWAFVGALACGCVDASLRAIAERQSPGLRAERYRMSGRTLIELAWMTAATIAMFRIGGHLVAGRPIEALFPILLLPLILAGGWLLLRALRALLVLVAGELRLLLHKLLRRDAAPAGIPGHEP